MVDQAIPIDAESRMIPDRIINTQTDKPAIEHVVLNLLDQLPFAANTEEDLQQQGSQ